MKVYIDGENLRHRLVNVLLHAGIIGDSEERFHFDVPRLISDALGEIPEAINYYTTSVKMPEFEIPQALAEHIEAIQAEHHYWVDELAKQGVNIVTAGKLKVHESSRCVHCGKRTQVLQEKGVDVRLATDMVLAAVKENVQHIVVFSSDTDMLPALEVVHHAGAKISYFCFAEDLNKALEAEADQTITYSREQVISIHQQTQAQL